MQKMIVHEITFREPQEPMSLVAERAAGPYRQELRTLWIDWPDTRHFVEGVAEHFSDALVLSTDMMPNHGRGPRKQIGNSIFDVLMLEGLSAYSAAHDSGDRARLRAFVGTILQEALRLLESVQVSAGEDRWTVHDGESLTKFLQRCGRPVEIKRIENSGSTPDTSVLANLVPERLKEVIAK